MSDEHLFNSFDYEKHRGIPEVVMRQRLLLERLRCLASRPDPILEIGVGTGDVTLMLATHFDRITSLDMDATVLRHASERLRVAGLANVEFIQSRIEEADFPSASYRHVILLGILEHLEDPVAALRRLSKTLTTDGRMYIVVNLAHSLHRHLGVEMGLINELCDLSESDIRLGHYRIYTPDLLADHVISAGLKITFELPFLLKPLPSSLMNTLPDEINEAFFRLGTRFPEFASYIHLEAAR